MKGPVKDTTKLTKLLTGIFMYRPRINKIARTKITLNVFDDYSKAEALWASKLAVSSPCRTAATAV